MGEACIVSSCVEVQWETIRHTPPSAWYSVVVPVVGRLKKKSGVNLIWKACSIGSSDVNCTRHQAKCDPQDLSAANELAVPAPAASAEVGGSALVLCVFSVWQSFLLAWRSPLYRVQSLEAACEYRRRVSKETHYDVAPPAPPTRLLFMARSGQQQQQQQQQQKQEEVRKMEWTRWV